MIPNVSRILMHAAVGAACSILTMAACGGSGAGQTGSTGLTGSSATSGGAAIPDNPIVIATDRGIEIIDDTGEVLRRISPTPARRPRLTGDGHLVFMAKGFAELRRVKLNGTGERPLALIPPTVGSSCDTTFPSPWDPSLLLRADKDMQLDGSTQAVCLHLTDGEDNSSSAWVRIDQPKGGRGRGTLGLVCGAEPPPADFQCQPRIRLVGKRASGTYEVLDNAIAAKGADKPTRKLAKGKLSEVAWSSSSPWSLVVAAVKKGNFVHRHVVALDRKSGQVYEIAPGPWPKPMSRKRWRALDSGKDISRTVAVQSDIRALGHDGLFVVDTLLIVPSRRIVDTRGQFAL